MKFLLKYRANTSLELIFDSDSTVDALDIGIGMFKKKYKKKGIVDLFKLKNSYSLTNNHYTLIDSKNIN